MAESPPVEVTIEARPERVRVFFDDQLVADTTRSVLVHETGLPPRRYIPPDDVELHRFARAHQGRCPHKGEWAFFTLRLGEKLFERAAWSYFEVTPSCQAIKDFVAFDEAAVVGMAGSIAID